MKPRIKVIADFWDNPFEVGDIIQFEHYSDYFNDLTGEKLGQDWSTDFLPLNNKDVTRYVYNLRSFVLYPHLFQPLPWYAERKPEDMPGYVKHNHNPEGSEWIVSKTDGQFFILAEWAKIDAIELLPATLEEYTAYQLSQKLK